MLYHPLSLEAFILEFMRSQVRYMTLDILEPALSGSKLYRQTPGRWNIYPRMKTLVKAGYVERTRFTPKQHVGNIGNAAAWIITSEGRKAANALRRRIKKHYSL